MDNLSPEEIRTLKRLANDRAKISSGWKWLGIRFGIPLILLGIAMLVFFFTKRGIGAPVFLPLLPVLGGTLILAGIFAIIARYRL